MTGQEKKTLFIVNPVAGKRLGARSAGEICGMLESAGFCAEKIETKCAGDAVRIIKEHGGGFDVIACTGGDGTLHEAANGIMALDPRPPVMYIPSGTTNVLASSLGLTGTPKSVCKKVISGTPKQYDIARFGERYFVYIASFGIFSSVSYSTPQYMKNLFGYMAYVLKGIKNLAELKSYDVKIVCEGKTIEDRVIFGAVSNAKSVAGLFKLNSEEISLSDGMFEAMFIKFPSSALELERIIAGLLTGQYDGEYIYFFRASQIEVSSDAAIEWGLDGEYAGSHGSVKIDIIPKGISIFS